MKYLLSVLFALAVCIEFFPHSYAEGPGALGLRRPVNAATMIDTSSTSIGTGAYVQLLAAASVTTAYSAIMVSNSGTSPIKIAFGAAASEVDTGAYIPGSSTGIFIPINGLKGTRIALRSLSGTQSSGLLTVAFFQ